MSLKKDSTTELHHNVIDLPVYDHFSRAAEILAGASPEEFQVTVATVLSELQEQIGKLQNLVFLLYGMECDLRGAPLTPEQRRELAGLLDVDLDVT